jgi:hypothetical protein
MAFARLSDYPEDDDARENKRALKIEAAKQKRMTEKKDEIKKRVLDIVANLDNECADFCAKLPSGVYKGKSDRYDGPFRYFHGIHHYGDDERERNETDARCLEAYNQGILPLKGFLCHLGQMDESMMPEVMSEVDLKSFPNIEKLWKMLEDDSMCNYMGPGVVENYDGVIPHQLFPKGMTLELKPKLAYIGTCLSLQFEIINFADEFMSMVVKNCMNEFSKDSISLATRNSLADVEARTTIVMVMSMDFKKYSQFRQSKNYESTRVVMVHPIFKIFFNEICIGVNEHFDDFEEKIENSDELVGCNLEVSVDDEELTAELTLI